MADDYEKYKEYYEKSQHRIREYYEKNKDKISSNHKKYYDAHKEELKEYYRLYREKNKEILKEKASVQVSCGCGSVYARRNETRHFQSKKHKEYEASKNNIAEKE